MATLRGGRGSIEAHTAVVESLGRLGAASASAAPLLIKAAEVQRGESTITIWRFSIRGICSTLVMPSSSERIRSSTRTPISW